MNNIDSTHYKAHYQAETGCQHCQGLFEHEPWCITRDANVQYAFGIVTDASKMTFSDTLILHSLGVSWINV
jgi:hypothetical protein